MSTQVESAPVTTLPVAEPVKAQEEVAAGSLIGGAGPQVVDTENIPPTESKAATTEAVKPDAAATKPKRSPLGELLNIVKPSKKEKAAVVAEDKPAETKTEEPVAEAPAPVVEEATPATDAVAEPATETVAPAAEEPKASSPKSGGFMDKLKHMFGEKKAKKAKSTEDIKAEPKTSETAPQLDPVATSSEETPAPVATEEVTPAPASTEVKTDAEVAQAIVEAPVETTTETPAETTTEAPKEDKVQEAKKKEKLGRRLSARITSLVSPKREKKEFLTSPAEEKTEETAATTEEPVPAPVAAETPLPEQSTSEVAPVESDAAPVALKEEVKEEEAPAPITLPETIPATTTAPEVESTPAAVDPPKA